MNKFVTSLILVASSVFALNSQAAWDAKYLPNPNGGHYFADYYVAQDQWRTVKQLQSFDTPDANGYLYIEHVAEYDCSRGTFALVQSRGFRTWDDPGVDLKSPAGTWQSVAVDSTQQHALNRMCSTPALADAKQYIK